MTLGRCPLSIFCSRGTPRHYKNPLLQLNKRISKSLRIVFEAPPDEQRAAKVLHRSTSQSTQREFFIDNLLVRVHHIE